MLHCGPSLSFVVRLNFRIVASEYKGRKSEKDDLEADKEYLWSSETDFLASWILKSRPDKFGVKEENVCVCVYVCVCVLLPKITSVTWLLLPWIFGILGLYF